MSALLIVFTALFIVIIPDVSFAWGPAVHIGVSLNAIGELPNYLQMLLFANLSEYLYGALAPDFIVGKSFSSKDKHSHNWSVGFDLLKRAKSDREKAFACGYLTHLAADAVAHGIIVKGMEDKRKNLKHTYIELVADSLSDVSYKELAKRILSRYNADLDGQFKNRVDSVLFSFTVSKLIFKGMVRASLGRKSLQRVLFNPKIMEFFTVDVSSIKEYVSLSEKFAVNVLLKGEDSPVLKLDAVSE
ncbi:zinc dependent phospholipase C family protein [Hippea alviniae]|uniref:zinc dependent phospholipase C family protein n=1 Tax=Hippea alviniae TaxID=1279027 RepID=UPI0003B337DE|nr:zinc dependent phospholipase C family protein [Hippea alviniae]